MDYNQEIQVHRARVSYRGQLQWMPQIMGLNAKQYKKLSRQMLPLMTPSLHETIRIREGRKSFSETLLRSALS